jgi:hypothetical protein
VGVLAWLVHNSGRCLTAITKNLLSKVSPNRIHHILRGKHLWGKLFPNPNWSKVSEAIGEVVQNGVKFPYKGNGTSKVIGRIKGSPVEVIVREAADGTKSIVDAWVRDPGL